MKRRLLSLLGVLGAAAIAAAAWPACSGDGDQVTPSDGGAGDAANDGDARDADARADAASDAEIQPVWDPVWHLTAPVTYPERGPEGQPSCGTGCRMALNWAIHTGRPSLMHACTETAVADYGDDGLYFAKLGSTTTSLLISNPLDGGAGQYGISEPSLNSDFVAYLVTNLNGKDVSYQLEVMNVVTGERKPAYRVRWDPPNRTGPFATALNAKYLFWAEDGVGLRSFNLATGAVRTLVPGAFFCVNMAANDRGVLCSDSDLGTITFTDQETGTRTAIDSGGAAQWDGEMSPDGRWYIWVDYRDPPGRASDYDKRNGGEVYMRDLLAGTTTRLTHDSPDTPRAKTYPSTDGKIAVWNEIPDGLDPNPSSNTAVYHGSDALVLFDLSTSRRCKIELPFASNMARLSIHGRHVYGYVGSLVDSRLHLADLDLDDPGLTWSCK